MALPTFRSLAARRQRKKEEQPTGVTGAENNSERTLTPNGTYIPGINVKLATKTRKNWILLSSHFFFISVIFLILVEIGNINDKAVIRNTYFFTLNLTNIIPSSAGDITLVNSLARSLGLHDFYQVGLWNFCEGYNDEGITYCSPTQTLYWFNPIEILLNELLAGATIALPAEINNILNLIKIASHLMFGFFLTGVCMNFVNIFLAPIVLYSRWWSFPFAIWTFISALLTTAATVIATVMFVIFKNVITSQQGLNIGAGLGTQMFVFMWIATAFSIFAWLIHVSLACCCASRRDVKTGRRKGRKSAYGDVGSDEKKRPVAGGRRWAKMPRFGRG
ncbi:uncharacterized protein K444DRAFT_615190 [Hyaloscypha bicolor E]|uniref:Integral membrane protein n=1 Tax=Hyaloscypha bicolor E TaxID=1095630 RepID=A0A2J6T176_9HELO|nr:uncharacterized protein K444DRAFT_615190 [Hyaloscypha bicolor E]PMD56776.1 hypothetical protein K444DRAFT_615190 [Hyaloscypha bicolor E]